MPKKAIDPCDQKYATADLRGLTVWFEIPGQQLIEAADGVDVGGGLPRRSARSPGWAGSREARGARPRGGRENNQAISGSC